MARQGKAPRCSAKCVVSRDAQRTGHRCKCPELRQAGRCRLVVLGFEVGGRWSEDSLDFSASLTMPARDKCSSFCASLLRRPLRTDGQGCWQLRPGKLSPPACCAYHFTGCKRGWQPTCAQRVARRRAVGLQLPLAGSTGQLAPATATTAASAAPATSDSRTTDEWQCSARDEKTNGGRAPHT